MASFEVRQWLREGIAAVKRGDDERARELLLQVVDADEYNEQAWLWLSSVVESDADRQVCLENVLAINPNNNLAKAGLVHLRERKAADLLTVELPPEPEPTPPPAESQPEASAMPLDWWKQPKETAQPPQEVAREPASGSPEPAVTADVAATPAIEETVPAAEASEPDHLEEWPEQRLEQQKEPHQVDALQRLLRLVLLISGLLIVALVALYVLGLGPVDAERSNYAETMDPLLVDYDDWWAGAYGELLNQLESFCGPAADGWRNQDILLVCGRYAPEDCELFAGHCQVDVGEIRERVIALSQEANDTGDRLWEAFSQVSPPEPIETAHTRFLACLRSRVMEAVRAGELARNGRLPEPEMVPACQMFPAAEKEVRSYVYDW